MSKLAGIQQELMAVCGKAFKAAWRLEDVYHPKFAAALFANMMAPSDDLMEGVFAAIFAEWYTLRFQGDGTRNLVRRVVDDGFFEPGRERDLADRIGDTVRWRVLDVLRPGANGTWIVRDAVTGETYRFYSVMFETGRDLSGTRVGAFAADVGDIAIQVGPTVVNEPGDEGDPDAPIISPEEHYTRLISGELDADRFDF